MNRWQVATFVLLGALGATLGVQFAQAGTGHLASATDKIKDWVRCVRSKQSQ